MFFSLFLLFDTTGPHQGKGNHTQNREKKRKRKTRQTIRQITVALFQQLGDQRSVSTSSSSSLFDHHASGKHGNGESEGRSQISEFSAFSPYRNTAFASTQSLLQPSTSMNDRFEQIKNDFLAEHQSEFQIGLVLN